MTGPTNQPLVPKKSSAFFAAVRARGVLNAMLDGPALAFEENNPGWKARWEYAPKDDTTFIVAREAMGFRIVDASELGELTESEQKQGPIRRGDLILMAGPEDIVAAIAEDDAKRAAEDFKLPLTSYKEHLKGIRVTTKSGDVAGPEPVGDVKVTQETVGVPDQKHELEP